MPCGASDDSQNKYQNYDEGQNVSHVRPHPVHDLQAASLVRLLYEVFPAPAISGGAEQDENESSHGQNIVTDDQVLEIQYRGSLSKRLDEGPHIEAQCAGKRTDEHYDRVYKAGLLPAPAKRLRMS